jgi:NADH:ubiquinone reductase (non-electrogenic)
VGQRVESPESWPFPRDERTNKIAAEKTLRVTGHARVFAVGDVARLSDDSSSDARTRNDAYVASPPPARFDVLPATAQVAFQQADYAAWNVWSSLSSRPLLPFKYQHIGDMMVLGKTDAAVALPVGDATLDGPVAALLRRAAYLYRMPTNEHRAKLATSWLEQGAEFAAKEGPGILKSLGVPVPDFLAPNQGPNSRT